MNPVKLLAHFDRISEAPDAVPRLRRFILDLAVRGKLVEQHPSDEPASELLKRIEAEKARLAKEGKIKRQQTLPVVGERELPFQAPSGWEPTRLAAVAVCLDYMRQPVNSEERAKRIAGKTLDQLVPYFGATQQQGWIDECLFDEELVLLGEDGVPFFDDLRAKAYLISGKAWVNNHAHVFRGILVSQSFLVHWLNAFDYRGRVAGATRSKLNQAKAVDIPVILPPIAEQHRIVTKVDELMALCDRLEAAQMERERQRDRLTAGSLHRLNQPANADDGAVFREHTRFHLSHLSRFTTRPDQIPALRQTILDLAVRGRLVTHNVNDESASDLFKCIQTEKARLISERVIPRPTLTTRARNGLVLDRPMNWETATLSDLCNFVTSGSRGWAEYYSKTGPNFIRAQNIRFGKLRFDDLACVSPPKKSEGRRTQVSKGDLLIVITGAGVTNPALLNHEIGEAYVSQHVALIRPTDKSLSEWILLCLMAPAGARAELVERAYGAGKPGLNLANIRSLAVPLPPLAEQHRIVAKVHELIAVCDRLEAQLTTAHIESRCLLEAVLREALVPAA